MVCPSCGATVPEDSIWLVGGTYYCSETCGRPAAHNLNREPYPAPARQISR